MSRVAEGQTWKRNPPYCEEVRVERVWDYPDPETREPIPSVRAQPVQGGRPLVMPVADFEAEFTQQQLEQSTTGKDKERNGASGEPLKRPGQQQATRSVSSVDASGDAYDTTGKETPEQIGRRIREETERACGGEMSPKDRRAVESVIADAVRENFCPCGAQIEPGTGGLCPSCIEHAEAD